MRVFNDMTDIVLDAPNAYHTLSKFVESGIGASFISKVIAEELPSRYRYNINIDLYIQTSFFLYFQGP